MCFWVYNKIKTVDTRKAGRPEREKKMKNEMAMIKDADGNEIFVVETIGKAKDYAKENGIGANGEYIAIGYFDDSNYFIVTDYEEI